VISVDTDLVWKREMEKSTLSEWRGRLMIQIVDPALIHAIDGAYRSLIQGGVCINVCASNRCAFHDPCSQCLTCPHSKFSLTGSPPGCPDMDGERSR
jgi:hypothetical protein